MISQKLEKKKKLNAIYQEGNFEFSQNYSIKTEEKNYFS